MGVSIGDLRVGDARFTELRYSVRRKRSEVTVRVRNGGRTMVAVSKTWVTPKGLPLPSAACEILGVVSQLTSPGAQCLHLGQNRLYHHLLLHDSTPL